MKREVIVAILFALCLPAVFAPAAPPETVYTVRPTITVQFDEQVRLKHADFLFENFSVIVNATETQVNASVLQFSPIRALANGEYTLRAEVEDRVGNAFTYTKRFIVEVPQTLIELVTPRLGFAQQSPFPLTIRTIFQGQPEQSVCKYMLADPFFDFQNFGLQLFDSSTGTSHSITAFNGIPQNLRLPTAFYAICQDSRERIGQQHFDLFVDTTPPEIETVVLDPITINERSEGGLFKTALSVKASEPVICKYSISTTDYAQMRAFESYSQQNTSAYHTTANQTVADFNPQVPTADYTIAIGCEDRSGRLTPVETRQIRVDLSEALTIAVVTPTAFPTESTIELKLRTNKNAHCLYGETDADTEMVPTNGAPSAKIHTASLGRLDDGQHTYHVLCSSSASGSTQTAEETVSFTIDRTPPGKPDIDGPTVTCQHNGFVFENNQVITFSANDSGSGISHYLFSLKQGTTLLVNESRSAGTLSSITTTDTGQPLNLTPRASYTLSVKAVDNAGKQSTPGTATLKYDPQLPVCREHNPPRITLLKEPTATGIDVTVVCTDDVACDNSTYLIDTDANQSSCRPSKRLFPPFTESMFSTQYFCYNVSDVNANSAAGGERITVTPLANRSNLTNLTSTCVNFRKDANETDVDCGGSCIPCDDGKKCRADPDCLSSYCDANKVCGRATCTDSIQNGEEKGKDCGGNCPLGCGEGTECVFNSECTTGYCDSATRTCAASSCSDGLKNGEETGKDCGGSCGACGEGESCKEDADCTSGKCAFGFCTGGKGGKDGGDGTDGKDSDGDGIPDDEEIRLGLDPNDPNDAGRDDDNDGLTNLEEWRYHTDIHKADTDGDGYSDGEEVAAGSDPLDPESKPGSNGGSILSILPLILGIILICYGLWALAYNRYVVQPNKAKPGKAMPTFMPSGPSPSQLAAQRQAAAERQRKLEEMRKKLREQQQGKFKDKLKIFDIFGTKQAPAPPEQPKVEKMPEAPPMRAKPQLEEPKGGWLSFGKRPGQDTFKALEELGKRSAPPVKKPSGDIFKELRGIGDKPKKPSAKKRR